MRKRLQPIVVIAALCFVIWAAVFIYRSSFITVDGNRYFCLADDAMISMRYAWNFSHGLGLVWNQNERVEGYTNLLMVLLMSPATLALDKRLAVLAVQTFGIVVMLGSAYLSMLISGHLMEDEDRRYEKLLGVLAFICALSYYPLAYWSLMGMETGLLTLLLLLGVLSVFRYTGEQRRLWLLLLSFSLGLAYLTRPDSAVPAAPILAYLFYEVYSRSKSLRAALPVVGIYALFIVGLTLFRRVYYGELVPNTYTLKVAGIPLLARIANGTAFVAPFLVEIAVVLVVVGAGLIFRFGKEKLLLVSIAVLLTCYQVWAGGDPWKYWRMMSPFMPLILLLFAHEIMGMILALKLACDRLLSQSRAWNRLSGREYLLHTLTAVLLFAALVGVNGRFTEEITMSKPPYQTDFNRSNVNKALILNEITTEDARMGVVSAGSIPYYTGKTAIDFLGKTDKHVAHLPPVLPETISWDTRYVVGHNKYDLDYSINTLQPTYVNDFKAVESLMSASARSKMRMEYVKIAYKGESLHLRIDSPFVVWDKITGELVSEVPADRPLVTVAAGLRGKVSVGTRLETPPRGIEQGGAGSELLLGQEQVLAGVIWSVEKRKVQVAFDVAPSQEQQGRQYLLDLYLDNKLGDQKASQVFDRSVRLSSPVELQPGYNFFIMENGGTLDTPDTFDLADSVVLRNVAVSLPGE